MSKTLFTRIIEGEIPCYKVYEDELVFAFLDIGPLSPGHTLLIPKAQVERLEDLPDETAAALGRALPKLGRAVLTATGASDYNVVQKNGPTAGQVVPHVHFHIIAQSADGGLRMDWKPQTLAADAGQAMAAAIAAALGASAP